MVKIISNGESSHFVNYHFVNSLFVNIDQMGIDKVGIDKVGIDKVGITLMNGLGMRLLPLMYTFTLCDLGPFYCG